MSQIQDVTQQLCETVGFVRTWQTHHRGKQNGVVPLASWSKKASLLHRAARRKPAIGIYGESQIGKSFLISSLATEGESILIRDPSGGTPEPPPIDFLASLNPQQGAESTGLITRFTSSKMIPIGSERRAFLAELLNYEDLILAMVHGVQHDVAPSASTREFEVEFAGRAKVVLDELRSAYREAPPELANIKVMESLSLAFNQVKDQLKYFGGFIRILDELKFDSIISMYQSSDRKPPDELLVKCISLLWGGDKSKPLLSLYTRLHQVLMSLEGSDVVEIPIESVLGRPGQESLLNVTVLQGLGGVSPLVPVFGRGHDPAFGGSKMQVPRAELAAVISEIVLPVWEPAEAESDSSSLISVGDIIDFPGSRAKGKETPIDLVKDDEAIKVYRRGKLMQIYRKLVIQDEIGVLCLGVTASGNTEASVPTQRAIELWLNQEIDGGVASPPLMAVFTKSDCLLVAVDSVARQDAVKAFVDTIGKLKMYSGEAYNWVDLWPGCEGSVAQCFDSTIFVFNALFCAKQGTKFRQDLDAFLQPTSSSQDLRRYCKCPESWIVGLAGTSQDGKHHGNIPALLEEARARLSRVNRVSMLTTKVDILLGEVKSKFKSRYRASTGVSPQERETWKREAADLRAALEGATRRRFSGSRSGLVQLQASAAITPAVVERAMAELKRANREDDVAVEVESVYEYVVKQWNRRLEQRVATESSKTIEKMFGQSAVHLRQLICSLPDQCERFKVSCMEVIEPRLAHVQGLRSEALYVAVAERWNSRMVDWGYPIEEDALVGGLAPQGDTSLHPGAWMLKHWASNVEKLLMEVNDPTGEPPSDNEVIGQILSSIESTRALVALVRQDAAK